jgi:hypothetical protein
MYMAFDLFPAGAQNRNASVLESAFGLAGDPMSGVR